MERRISPDNLILPRPTCEVAQKGIVNGLIFSQYRQAVAMEDLDEAFYESVSQEMREQGIERSKAMDLVRIKRLIDACDSKEDTALYLLEEWNYEPQVSRFLRLLSDLGVDFESVKDSLQNTPLHMAAKKNYTLVGDYLMDRFPSMLLTANAQNELPIEIAIRNYQDDMAAFLIRRMDHRRVKDLFSGIKQQGKDIVSFLKMTKEFKMQKTIVAVLDSLISPRWPHPPSLPSDILPCLSWEQLPETPTHYYVAYDILESDDNGKFPDDPSYEHPHQSCLYNLASHWHKNLDEIAEGIINHVVIQLLTERKWRKYASFWCRVRSYHYMFFVCALGASLVYSVSLDEPLDYGSSSFRAVFDVLILFTTFFFMLEEIIELKREPFIFVKDPWNYLNVSGCVLIFLTFVYRLQKRNYQWTFACFAFSINSLGIFKHTSRDRYIGEYVKCLYKVIYRDMPRFLYVFGIILFTFTVSYYLALQAHKDSILLNGELVNNRTIRGDISCTGEIWCVMLAGLFAWLEGTFVVNTFEDVGIFGGFLILAFMLSVTIILLNILIAQLSLTYETVQEESQHSFTAMRMQAVAIVEWGSRFRFWNVRKKYYVAGEIKPREEIEAMLQKCRERSESNKSITDHLKEIRERFTAMETNLQSLRCELESVIQERQDEVNKQTTQGFDKAV
nr:uncharacterized protein LOC131794749 [Pocillopora verrucosa]